MITNKEADIFINFLEINYNKYQCSYKNEYTNSNAITISNGLWFYGEDNTKIVMIGNQTTTNFTFLDANNDNQVKGSIDIDYDKIKPFVDKLFNECYQNKMQELYSPYSSDDDFINQQIDLIKEYLKCVKIDVVDDYYKYDYTLNIPSYYKGEKLIHKLRIGRLVKGNPIKPTTIEFLGQCEIPLTLALPNNRQDINELKDHQNNWIQLNWLIFGREVVNYPNLSDYVIVKKTNNSLKSLLLSLKEKSPQLGNLLDYTILEQQVPKKEYIVHKNKI